MNSYPQFAKVEEKKYKINTDYKVALECEKKAKLDISDEERALAIIYLLYGDEGMDNPQHWNELLQLGLKYLNCGKEYKENKNEEVDMDFEEDWEYIRTSFFSDYALKIKKDTYIHWWEFYNLLCGLSDKCILSRVRFVRNFDISSIKDGKEKQKWIEQKENVALKKVSVKTSEERRLDELFEKQMKGE